MSESNPNRSRGLGGAHTTIRTNSMKTQETRLQMPLGKLNEMNFGNPNLGDSAVLQEFEVAVGATPGTVIGQLDPVRGNVRFTYPYYTIGNPLFEIDQDGEITVGASPLTRLDADREGDIYQFEVRHRTRFPQDVEFKTFVRITIVAA
jgi:hypothetical protein